MANNSFFDEISKNDEPFKFTETEGYVLIDQGNGMYKVKTGLIIEIKENKARIIDQSIHVEKLATSIYEVPQEFREAVLSVDDQMDISVIRKFYLTISDSKENGVTVREITRACGIAFTSGFCRRVLEILLDKKFISYEQRKSRGAGRPKFVVFLREYA